MFAPLAFAYIISILASLIVALTVTPVLCYFLLGRSSVNTRRERFAARHMAQRQICESAKLDAQAARTRSSGASAAMILVAVLVVPLMGREFLPPFNEGALNINANLPPGTSLAESNRIGNIIEEVLHQTPEVVSTTGEQVAPSLTSTRRESIRAKLRSSLVKATGHTLK